MTKRKFIVWGVIAAAFLYSCSAVNYHIRDGHYSAEASDFDIYGWKEYLTIYVSSGRIILAEYNAFNASGLVKSWDMNYMREMNAVSGTYPNAYSRFYAGKLLENQGTEGVDCLSGATYSYRIFMGLAKAVLENARQGKTETSLIKLSAPPSGPR